MKRITKILTNINNLLEKYNTVSDIENILKNYLYNHKINDSFLKDYYFLGVQVPNIKNRIWYSIDRYNQKNRIHLMINNHKFLIKK